MGQGACSIGGHDSEFDPVFHEAVAMEESDELPHNMISEEMLRGFRIGNKVIRHSMVKVTTSSQPTSESSHANEDVLTEEVVEAEIDLLTEADIEFPDNAPASHEASPQEAD